MMMAGDTYDYFYTDCGGFDFLKQDVYKRQDQYKANIEDVYDYIIMTLKKAIELLPEKDPTGLGRIDKYCAEGLLTKVYLTKSGFDPATTTYEQGSVAYIKTCLLYTSRCV